MLELSDIEEKSLRAVLGALGELEHAGRASVLQLAHLMHKLGIGSENSNSNGSHAGGSGSHGSNAHTASTQQKGNTAGKRTGRPPGRPAAAAPTFQPTAKVKGRPGRPPGSGANKPAAASSTAAASTAGKPGRRPGRPAGQSNAGGNAVASTGTGSIKQFLSQKQPSGALQRTAVLGYYLHQNKKLPSFSNAEIDAANKESGAEAFSNVHVTVNNAIVRGLIERADRGKRKLTPAGRAFVEALPDRQKAQASVRELQGAN